MTDNVKVERSALSKSLVNGDTFITEASELGWPPGYWPRMFSVDRLGNGEAFAQMRRDQTGAWYKQAFSPLAIHVYND